MVAKYPLLIPFVDDARSIINAHRHTVADIHYRKGGTKKFPFEYYSLRIPILPGKEVLPLFQTLFGDECAIKRAKNIRVYVMSVYPN